MPNLDSPDFWRQLYVWDTPDPVRVDLVTDTAEEAREALRYWVDARGYRHPVPHRLRVSEYGRADEMPTLPPLTLEEVPPPHGAEDAYRYQGVDPPPPAMTEAQREELARFEYIVSHLDPAASAWNPVTGLEPVLCRVCGEYSDPAAGKVLVHCDRYPCAPRTERPDADGSTTQVRDSVLRRSANVREDVVAPRLELEPVEVLALTVEAWRRAGLNEGQVRRGAVRECPRCLAVSPSPGWPVQHDQSQCSATSGGIVTDLDPRHLMVAAIHIPGPRSLTDPEWWHLGAGFWVAHEGTEGPGWADLYVESVPILQVAAWARTPRDLDPVRLSLADRTRTGSVADTLNSLARYFRLLDRPATVHGITALTQAMANAVERCWAGLESLHDEDDGALLHAGLGSGDSCPVCERREPATSPATERQRERLAVVIHARCRGAGARRALSVKAVWIILDTLTDLRAHETLEGDTYPLATQATGMANHRLWRDPHHTLRGITIYEADTATVLREYRAYLAAGGERSLR